MRVTMANNVVLDVLRNSSTALGYGLRIFLFATVSRPALEPIQSPIQWVPGVKRPCREADHSSPSNAEVTMRGAILPPLMPSWREAQSKQRDIFTFYFPPTVRPCEEHELSLAMFYKGRDRLCVSFRVSVPPPIMFEDQLPGFYVTSYGHHVTGGHHTHKAEATRATFNVSSRGLVGCDAV